jgi:cytochrome c553
MKRLTVLAVRFVVPVMGIFFLRLAPLRAQDAAALYKSKCAACRGADGSGNVPTGKTLGVTDLTSGDLQKQTDAQLTDSIANGKGKKMPAYKGKLTDDQIKGCSATFADWQKSSANQQSRSGGCGFPALC